MIAIVLAAIAPTAFLPAGPIADAPAGFAEMCARDPQACGLTSAPALLPQRSECVFADWTDLGDRSADHRPATVAPAFLTREMACAPVGTGEGAGTAAIVGRKGRSSTPRSRGDGTLMRVVQAVNARINHVVRQRSDLELYGVEELWRAAGDGPAAAGDCEDIALEKRAALIAARLPADRVRLATAFVPRAGLHTVLVVRLPKGDFVLDSMTSAMVRWDRAPMVWLRVQDAGSPMVWRTVSRRPA